MQDTNKNRPSQIDIDQAMFRLGIRREQIGEETERNKNEQSKGIVNQRKLKRSF